MTLTELFLLLISLILLDGWFAEKQFKRRAKYQARRITKKFKRNR